VLHISHEHAVDHVRAYYDEIFHDLAMVMKLDEPEAVRVDIEKNRLIYSHLPERNDPPSIRGGLVVDREDPPDGATLLANSLTSSPTSSSSTRLIS
jgi:hypothetical protein